MRTHIHLFTYKHKHALEFTLHTDTYNHLHILTHPVTDAYQHIKHETWLPLTQIPMCVLKHTNKLMKLLKHKS